MEVQPRSRERNFGDRYALFRSAVVDQRLIPIDLQVRHNTNFVRAWFDLAGEVDGNRSWQSRGKAHVVDHALPASIRFLRLDVWGRDSEVRLIGGVHRVGSEVLGKAIEQQMKRPRRVPLAKIENQRLRLADSGEGQA